MPRGGKREGAGRKPGSKTKRTRAQIKAVVEADGTVLTPAAVMQKAMEVHYRARRYDKAAAIAKDLAPYVHARRPLAPQEEGNVIIEVVVKRDRNFYGNAHRLPRIEPAGQPAPSDGGTGAPSADESRGVR